ncbi:MAG: cytochrome ubiquinol oxidase subunit I [Flavobacteriales bacterium]|nr:cytochrome ubiquinol oxidase subunit I [Flavobacteriales bacterium]
MKLAAAEALVSGERNAPLTILGYVSEDKKVGYDSIKTTGIAVPSMLSFLADGKTDTFVPGIKDLIEGNEQEGILSVYEKMKRGREAQIALSDLKNAEKGSLGYEIALKKFYDPQWKKDYFSYFGYGYYYSDDMSIMQKNAQMLIPPVPLIFYTFRIMIALGILFTAVFIVGIYLSVKKKLDNKRWFYWVALLSIPLVYVCSMSGWIVAEVGRQPWVIQDLMPTVSAVSQVSTAAVQTTFWIFALTFTVLLIAEIRIMTTQIKKGIN